MKLGFVALMVIYVPDPASDRKSLLVLEDTGADVSSYSEDSRPRALSDWGWPSTSYSSTRTSGS